MAHFEQQQFVAFIAERFPTFFRGTRVLEVGSLDLNGSVRSNFSGCDYLGIDVAAGPGVDLVCQGQDYDAPDGSFDVVTSCEAMEHNPYWRETFANMLRLCRPGGLILMTCATTGRGEHGTTRKHPGHSPLTVEIGWDHYRNLTAADFRAAVDLPALVSVGAFYTHIGANDLYFAGFRAGAPAPSNAARALTALRWRYLAINAGAVIRHPKRILLLALLGEQRLHAGHRTPRWMDRLRGTRSTQQGR